MVQKNILLVQKQYLDHVKQQLPNERAQKPCIVGMIGLIGSGKSTAAKIVCELRPGFVVARSNAARFLLKQAGLPWGENVRGLILYTVRWLISEGYGAVIDTDHVEQEKRDVIQKLANELHVPFYLIRVTPRPDVSLKRLEKRWRDLEEGVTKQDIENFLVVTRGKEQNLFDRVPLHEQLQSKDVPQIIGGVDNIGSLEELRKNILEVLIF